MKDKRGRFFNSLLVGIPTSGMVDIDFAMNMVYMSMPVNTCPIWYHVKGEQVATACNMIVKRALEANGGKGTDYIYFREDDVITPSGALERLMARDVDIISGVCMAKQVPPFPIVFKTWGGGSYIDWYDSVGDVVEVCGTGLACTLIKTDVFRKVEPPWFKTFTYTQTQEEVDDTPISRMTQDLYFYRKALAKGFKVWVDTGVLCGHKDIDQGIIYYFDMKLKCPAWIKDGDKKPSCIAPVKRTKRAIELTTGERRENNEYLQSIKDTETFGSIEESSRQPVLSGFWSN